MSIDNTQKLFIGGCWESPLEGRTLDVIDPATEQVTATIAIGGEADVDRAVTAARGALEQFAQTTIEERVDLLEQIIDVYEGRRADLADAIRREMGAPAWLAAGDQVDAGLGFLRSAMATLRTFPFQEDRDSVTLVYEPIGVCGLITPWNWPLNQIGAKVGPALAAGCTMVLKPSEVAPLSGIVFAEILEEAGVPAGVFNLVHGDGATVGVALASHPDIDMVSFTGSTRAGVEVARNAAATVKRVTQELGGKSANILLDDVDLTEALARDIPNVFVNSGQSCDAGTRILVPGDRMDEAIEVARKIAEQAVVGPPEAEVTVVGPVVSQVQFDRIQGLIEKGIDEGATLVTGGMGKPDGLSTGYYVKPTVFAHVTNDMAIAQEEIFGPVIALLGYEDEDEAVRIANDSRYGLSSLVSSADADHALRVARRLRAGDVHVNGAYGDAGEAPFGGYKQSGNGREGSDHGLREYLEVKAIYHQ